MKAKDVIVVTLTIGILIVVVVPVIMAAIGALTYGKPVSNPEFLKTAGEIVTYILGIISGYVLNRSGEEKGQ